MKKQIALVFALASLLFSSCNDEDPVSSIPTGNVTVLTPEPGIRSVYPNAGAPGSTVAIFGENFGSTMSENYVTFASSTAEVTYASEGMINVLVPDLQDGDYEITVHTRGTVRRAPQMFSVFTNKP